MLADLIDLKGSGEGLKIVSVRQREALEEFMGHELHFFLCFLTIKPRF